MSDLIEALQIFLKYGNPKYPTHCEHDVLLVCLDPTKVSTEDRCRLSVLGFDAELRDGDWCFRSYRFGSC